MRVNTVPRNPGSVNLSSDCGPGYTLTMSFCEHCEGQRFDRAQVLRLLRATRKTLNKRCSGDEALRMAIKAVKELDIPHMERFDETVDGEVIH
jgi:hypothetical protein